MAKGSGPEPRETVQELFDEALKHHRAGHLDKAEALYRRINQTQPDHPDALHLLGVLAHQAGRHAAAVELIGRAIVLNDGQAGYHNNMAEACRAQGRTDEALDHYRRAVALAPDFADAHYNLAITLGGGEEAVRHLRRTVEIEPAFADAWFALGNLLRDQGRLDDAGDGYRRAIAAQPGMAEAHTNLGNLLKQQGNLPGAVAAHRRAVAARPDFAEAHVNLGSALHEAEDLDGAIASYTRALEIAPDMALAHLNLATALENQDRIDEAAARFDEALARDPHLSLARWTRPLLLPVLYDSEDEIEHYRDRFAAGLAQLDAATTGGDPDAMADAFAGLGVRTCFRLNYQGRNDRALQERFGAMACRVMGERFPAWSETQPAGNAARRDGGRLRIGYAGTQFRRHTVTKLFGGWITGADRDRFQVFAYHLGTKTDATTERIRESCDDFFQVGNPFYYEDAEALAAVCARIVGDRLDVLVYPELGMERGTMLLAALRLAPVQCAAWGHPVTTGLPSIDYFLTSDLMEPPGGEEHYRERLVRLANLSVCYARPAAEAAAKSRRDFGLGDDAVVYLSCQSLFKYLPRDDHVFPAIARRVPGCRFVFISHPVRAITEKFQRRLHRAFDERGLASEDHCVFTPRLGPEDYRDLNLASDIYLDSISWSGGNTTFEAVAYGLPVVTCPGRLMRARHGHGILKRMGMDELIADTVEDYVDIAQRLALDTDFRRSMTAAVKRRAGRIFDDRDAVRSLEDFYVRAVAAAGGGGS